MDRPSRASGQAPRAPNDEVDALLVRARDVRNRDPRTGIELALEALEVLDRSGGEAGAHRLRETRVHTELGAAYKEVGDFRSSLHHARRALALCRKAGLKDGTLDNLATVGWCHLRAANYPAALASFLEALDLARELGQGAMRARLLLSMCAVHSSLRQYDKAVATAREALDVAREAEYVAGMAMASNNLAMALMLHGQLEEAQACVETALALQETLEQFPMMAHVFRDTLGQILYRAGRFESALACFEETLAGVQETGARRDELVAHRNLGTTRLALGDGPGAREDLEIALAFAEEIGATGDLADCHRELCAVFKALGDPVQALAHNEAYIAAELRMHEVRVQSRLGVLEVEHEVEKARDQAEIHRLKSVELARTVSELEATKTVLEERMQELSRLNEHIREMSLRDGLTGVHNRRYLDSVLLAAIHHAARHGRHLSVALADIDQFKAVNDRFSHGVGDEVIKKVAQIFAEESRASDCVARYGGEEFALVMPEADREDCRRAAERIRQRIEAHAWSEVAPGLDVTVSIGVAEHSGERRPEDLLQAADALLYEAKRQGRNRVVSRRRDLEPTPRA